MNTETSTPSVPTGELNSQQLQAARASVGIGGAPNVPDAANTSDSQWSQFDQTVSQDQPQAPQPTEDQQEEQNINSQSNSFSVKNGDIPGADKVIQDVGQAAKETNEALTSPWSPIGWVTDAIGGASKLLGAPLSAIDDVIAPKIGDALRNVVGGADADKIGSDIVNAANSPEGQKIIASAKPALADVGAVGNVAQLAGTTVAAGTGAEAMGDLANPDTITGKMGAKVSQGTSDLVNGAKERIVGTPKTAEDVTGQIVQGTGKDISTAQRALSSIDTTGVKTFSDLSDKLDSQIKDNTSQVDTKLGENKTLYKPSDLNQSVPVKGGEPIVSNPVSDALDQLNKFYEKTNDTENLARIKGLQNEYETDGLNSKQINDIAREHGQELNGYNANGELASGLSRQAAENTRMGVKSTVRALFPDDETAGLDKNTSDLIKTKGMVDDMDNKVQQLQNKLKSYSPLQKLGRFAGKAVDFATGGIAKGFVRSVMGIGGDEGSTMNPLQLQDSLAKNLQLLDKLNGMPADQAWGTIGRMLHPSK